MSKNQPPPAYTFIMLDDVKDHELDRKRPTLSRRFKTFVFCAFVIDLILLSSSITGLIVWWSAGHSWVFFLRFPTLIRMILLIVIMCSKIPVDKLIGVPKMMKLPAHMAAVSKPLGLWMIIGLLDVFMIRIFLTAVDIFYFSITLQITSSHGIFTILLDLAYIAEFWVTLWLVYSVGVRRTVNTVILSSGRRNGLSAGKKLGKLGAVKKSNKVSQV